MILPPILLVLLACNASATTSPNPSPPRETVALPPQWTPAPPLRPTVAPSTLAPSPTRTQTSIPTPSIPDQNALNASYPPVDSSDLYLYPNKYTYVRFRITSSVVWIGYHDAFYPGTPVPVRQFIVQLDPRFANPSFQYPFIVAGLSDNVGISVGDTLTVYGYGLGAMQGDNAAGGVSNGAAIFAEFYSLSG